MDAEIKSIDELAEIKGLVVYETYEGTYWNPEYKNIQSHPENWILIESGDAALTRKIRKANHWVLKREVKGFYKVVGTLVNKDIYDQAIKETGGDAGKTERIEKKKIALENKEAKLTLEIRNAIIGLFPNIPGKNLEGVLNQCRQKGKVGKSQYLYFSNKEYREENITELSRRAVIAYVRHKYTRYEDILENIFEYDMEFARKQARDRVRPDIDKKLDLWQ